MARALRTVKLVVCVLAAVAAVCAAPARAQQQQQAGGGGGEASSQPPPPAAPAACPLPARPTVSKAGNNPGKVPHAFTPEQAEQFIVNQASPRVLNHLTTTFDCVDSRSRSHRSDGSHDHFGTAGGDAAELAAAIAVYCKLTGTECSFDVVQRIFKRFMNEVASPARPFYLHQAEGKVHKVLDDVAASGLVSVRPPALPAVAPEDEALREVYLNSLVEGAHQGCGHLRLMIDRFADYGLDSADVPQKLIRAFYLYWWPTPLGSPERAKIEFPLLQGDLAGSAVLIVGAAAETGACAHHSPAFAHAAWGAQAFVFNKAAVDDFRARVLTPFFGRVAAEEQGGAAGGGGAKGALPPSFYAELSALQDKQLTATLTHLDTAKDSPLLAVNFF